MKCYRCQGEINASDLFGAAASSHVLTETCIQSLAARLADTQRILVEAVNSIAALHDFYAVGPAPRKGTP